MAAGDTATTDRELLISAAKNAGEIALRYFEGSNPVWYKSGNSPVSKADQEVNQYLLDFFRWNRPDYGWLSEETEDDLERLELDTVVIVDPIDGTRGFIEGRQEWCISIAVVRNGRPVDAVLHCPALQRTFAASKGSGLELIDKRALPKRSDKILRVTASEGPARQPFASTGFYSLACLSPCAGGIRRN